MSCGSWLASSGAASAMTAPATSSSAPSTSVGCLRSQRQRRGGAAAGRSGAVARAPGIIVIRSRLSRVTRSGLADARVEEPIAEIDQQVDEHVNAGREQEHALD